MSDEAKELNRQVVEGIVKEVEGEEALVSLSIDGYRRKRRMVVAELARAGVTRVGQTFTAVVRKLELPDGRQCLETVIIGDADKKVEEAVATIMEKLSNCSRDIGAGRLAAVDRAMEKLYEERKLPPGPGRQITI